jgi:hypothetical protein
LVDNLKNLIPLHIRKQIAHILQYFVKSASLCHVSQLEGKQVGFIERSSKVLLGEKLTKVQTRGIDPTFSAIITV